MGALRKALLAEVSSYAETEWTGTLGGEALTLYAQPLTPADITVISRRHPNFTSSPNLEGMIDLIVRKATIAKGEHAFDKSDKPVLMRVGTNKIGEIFSELFGEQLEPDNEEEREEREKN